MELKTSWLINKPIAHRGLHNEEFPENSLPAFQNAAEHGLPVELDVRLTDDRTVVVFHDEKLSRMTDSDGYVSNLQLSDLENIKLKKTDYGIPTFEQVLETVNERVPILIEIKKSETSFALEEKLIDMLKGYNGEYAVQSFDPFALEYCYKNAPRIMRGQLSSYFHHADIDASHRDKVRLKKTQIQRRLPPRFHFVQNNKSAQQIRKKHRSARARLDGQKRIAGSKSIRAVRQHHFRRLYARAARLNRQ